MTFAVRAFGLTLVLALALALALAVAVAVALALTLPLPLHLPLPLPLPLPLALALALALALDCQFQSCIFDATVTLSQQHKGVDYVHLHFLRAGKLGMPSALKTGHNPMHKIDLTAADRVFAQMSESLW